MRTFLAAAIAATALFGGATATEAEDAAATEADDAAAPALAAPADLSRADAWNAGEVMLGAGPPAGMHWPAMLAPDGSVLTPDSAGSLSGKAAEVTFFDLKQAEAACGASPDCTPGDALAGPGLTEPTRSLPFPVPTPAALALLGGAMALLALFGRRLRS